MTPHAGYSYRFCDDGLPPTGGATANPAGTSAVEVPAAYEGFAGLPEKAPEGLSVPGADPDGNIALDVDISVPDVAAPAGGFPLLVFMHGCCSGNKTSWEATSFDTAGERWHYSNAWYAARGYVVINYTSRGFHNGESNGSRGSTGETQLDSRRFEINDFQHLAGQVADDPFFDVNPEKVVVTGGSYGGGFSWMAATDPIWESPGGLEMKLAAAAPKYGWTDLVYSLVPTGKHGQLPGALPAFDGSDSSLPIGVPKKSILAALYDSGKTGIPPGSAHATFSTAIDEAFACLQSTDPYETNPLCATTISDTLPEFINDRSAYYQDNWFTLMASEPAFRTPVFNAATFTDPLFTPVENRRMANRLLATVPDYPIQQYFGDYQHFVQNKAKEWGDICGGDRHVCGFADYPGGDLNATPAGHARTGVTTRLNRFIDHYAQPPGNPSQPAPQFDVTASLQVCPQNAGSQPADEPGDTYTAGSFEALTSGTLQLDMSGNQTTTNDAAPNPHAANAEPVANSVLNGGRCPAESSSSLAGPGVAVYTSEPLARSYTMLGATSVAIDYSATTAEGLQLNARLYDVFPDGSSVMVDRGVRRVENASGTVTYELHGNGWRFPAGHRVRIEIAQDDDPFLRASTVPSVTTISHVTLRIPVREETAYPRPRGATPLRVPLVVAYKPCTAPNRAHAAPLAFDSCSPPQQSSAQLTVGTPDANGQAPHLVGSIRYAVQPGDPATTADEANVVIDVKIDDVRRRSDLADYTGEVLANHTLRITDRHNGSGQNEPGTMVEHDFPVLTPCHGTADPARGADCSVTTTANSIVPGAIKEGKRTIWQLGQVNVLDGQSDLFLTQGVFIP